MKGDTQLLYTLCNFVIETRLRKHPVVSTKTGINLNDKADDTRILGIHGTGLMRGSFSELGRSFHHMAVFNIPMVAHRADCARCSVEQQRVPMAKRVPQDDHALGQINQSLAPEHMGDDRQGNMNSLKGKNPRNTASNIRDNPQLPPPPSAGMTQENQGTWDSTTQTFHGGQDWAHLPNFVDDFSVTTNGLGTPEAAMQAALKAVLQIKHYPPSDFEPAASGLAKFLWPDSSWVNGRRRLLLGNGASELIDLVIRNARPGGWRPGPQRTQYKEYARSAIAASFTTTHHSDRSASLLCMVNPTNPTGDYWSISEMKAYIGRECEPGTTVIVDESMQPWLGPNWRDDSLYSQSDWIKTMSEERNVHVWIITSWTKIWCCCGVRLGSVVAPTPLLQKEVKAKQVPWSVNTIALHFLSEAVKDTGFLKRTWEVTRLWNRATREEILAQHPEWEVQGKEFLSWVWVDTHDESVAKEVIRRTRAAGVPVRSGAPGYNLPTFFRAAVRSEEHRSKLMRALSGVREPDKQSCDG